VFLALGLDGALAKKLLDPADIEILPLIVHGWGNQYEVDASEDEDTEDKGRTEASPEGESALSGLIKKLICSTNENGYITYDQVDPLLSRDDIKSEQIEGIWHKLAG
jgi:Sigma-70 factor, region 1.1